MQEGIDDPVQMTDSLYDQFTMGDLCLRGTATLFFVLFAVFLDDLILQDPGVGRLPDKRRVAQGHLLGSQYSVASEAPLRACTL